MHTAGRKLRAAVQAMENGEDMTTNMKDALEMAKKDPEVTLDQPSAAAERIGEIARDAFRDKKEKSVDR
jgi:hypothetical protein